MNAFEIAALTGLLIILAWLVLAMTLRLDTGRSAQAQDWWIPAIAAIALLGWTLFCLIDEGFLAVIPAISLSAWSNQVWFDLLLAISVALAFLVPEARRLGMNPWIWFVLIAASGSIALLGMLARVLYLRAQGPDTITPGS
ncbi:MAG: hypothetical protein AAGJ52_04485 [Pseudomonadota bacterium]